jgi:hypothetical protein
MKEKNWPGREVLISGNWISVQSFVFPMKTPIYRNYTKIFWENRFPKKPSTIFIPTKKTGPYKIGERMLMRKLFTAILSSALIWISLTCAAKDFTPGQTYYIIGRQVWVRSAPNTDEKAYNYWRFGESVTYVRSENGFALVSIPDRDIEQYVYEDYLGDTSEMEARKKPYTDWVLTLDRHFDQLVAWRIQLEQNAQTKESLAEAIQEEEKQLTWERGYMANSNLPPDVLEDLTKVSLALTNLAEVLRKWDNDYSGEAWSDFCYYMNPAYTKLGERYR